ncbi:MAG: hypothetical protein ACXWCZ_12355 [Flavisolibacter sp.]
MSTDDKDFTNSVIREKMLLHFFLSDVYQYAWHLENSCLEVLVSEVDNSGYDLAIGLNGELRFIQLKATRKGSATNYFPVNLKLRDKNGVIILMNYDFDKNVLIVKYSSGAIKNDPENTYYKPSKHTKANALGIKSERDGTIRYPKKDLTRHTSVAELLNKLFYQGLEKL